MSRTAVSMAGDDQTRWVGLPAVNQMRDELGGGLWVCLGCGGMLGGVVWCVVWEGFLFLENGDVLGGFCVN